MTRSDQKTKKKKKRAPPPPNGTVKSTSTKTPAKKDEIDKKASLSPGGEEADGSGSSPARGAKEKKDWKMTEFMGPAPFSFFCEGSVVALFLL